MNISPRTGRPKIVAGDKMAATRFVQFCEMLTQYGDKFDIKQVGPRAVAAKQAVESLLEAIDLEMLPKGKRPDDHPLLSNLPLFANLKDDETKTLDEAKCDEVEKPSNGTPKSRGKKADKAAATETSATAE